MLEGTYRRDAAAMQGGGLKRERPGTLLLSGRAPRQSISPAGGSSATWSRAAARPREWLRPPAPSTAPPAGAARSGCRSERRAHRRPDWRAHARPSPPLPPPREALPCLRWLRCRPGHRQHRLQTLSRRRRSRRRGGRAKLCPMRERTPVNRRRVAGRHELRRTVVQRSGSRHRQRQQEWRLHSVQAAGRCSWHEVVPPALLSKKGCADAGLLTPLAGLQAPSAVWGHVVPQVARWPHQRRCPSVLRERAMRLAAGGTAPAPAEARLSSQRRACSG